MDKHLKKQLEQVRIASRTLATLTTKKKNDILETLAKNLLKDTRAILAANKRDFKALPSNYGLVDRLLLTEDRIKDMCTSLRSVKRLADPVGTILYKKKQASGIIVQKTQVPIGVLGVIYEARPNVTIEIASLCLKTGNAVVLKGSRDAHETNKALVRAIHKTLKTHKLPVSAVQLINPFKRSLTAELLAAHGYVDIVIPRGSDRLIQFVRETAKVPVIETGAGVCHTYAERSGNTQYAIDAVVNAKTRRYSVCNALDTLVVDEAISKRVLTGVAEPLAKQDVVIYADPKSYKILKTLYPSKLLKKAKAQHFGKEFLSMKMSVKTVKDFSAGLSFVQDHTSGHSESIITSNKKRAAIFTQTIDAAAVYVNTSTAFTDGFEFGLGAEVGISTQKLHARGPMGLEALTTYKWIVTSSGKIRSS